MIDEKLSLMSVTWSNDNQKKILFPIPVNKIGNQNVTDDKSLSIRDKSACEQYKIVS